VIEIRKRYIIPGTVEEVWQALTDVRDMEAWGARPAEMDPRRDRRACRRPGRAAVPG